MLANASRFGLSCSVVFFALGVAAGCSSGDDGLSKDGTISTQRQAVIRGVDSTADQDSVVNLSYDGDRTTGCSGTLIAKNLVLTARHCVSFFDDTGTITGEMTASQLNGKTIFVGRDGPQKNARGDAPDARGKLLVVPTSTNLFPTDIALIVLDRNLTAPIAPIRIDGGAVKGEDVTLVGFGVDETSVFVSTRKQRRVKVEAIGPATLSYFILEKGEFWVKESSCAGDSGAPMFDTATKAVVGVVSRGRNGVAADPNKLAQTCTGANAEDVLTDLSAPVARAAVLKAFEAAGATRSSRRRRRRPHPATTPTHRRRTRTRTRTRTWATTRAPRRRSVVPRADARRRPSRRAQAAAHRLRRTRLRQPSASSASGCSRCWSVGARVARDD